LKNDFNEVEDVLGRPYSIFWMGSDDGITSSKSQRLLRQIPLATDKLLAQHPPPSGELKNEETNPRSQAVFLTGLPLDLDGKSRFYQVALSANATHQKVSAI
jgi:hypothetical protein